MFGLGMTEIILIAVVALVVIGPKRLPDIAKSIGKGYGEFKRSFGDLKQAVNLDDIDKPASDTKNSSQSQEGKREEIIDTYRSQWEQKLPVVENHAENLADVKSESPAQDKKDGGESSGR